MNIILIAIAILSFVTLVKYIMNPNNDSSHEEYLEKQKGE